MCCSEAVAVRAPGSVPQRRRVRPPPPPPVTSHTPLVPLIFQRTRPGLDLFFETRGAHACPASPSAISRRPSVRRARMSPLPRVRQPAAVRAPARPLCAPRRTQQRCARRTPHAAFDVWRGRASSTPFRAAAAVRAVTRAARLPGIDKQWERACSKPLRRAAALHCSSAECAPRRGVARSGGCPKPLPAGASSTARRTLSWGLDATIDAGKARSPRRYPPTARAASRCRLRSVHRATRVLIRPPRFRAR